jgi:hypothetical protein
MQNGPCNLAEGRLRQAGRSSKSAVTTNALLSRGSRDRASPIANRRVLRPLRTQAHLRTNSRTQPQSHS